MKKILLIIGAALLAATTAQAQNTNVTKLLQATNFSEAVYWNHFSNNGKDGGGAMILYNFNQYVGAGLGLDWCGKWTLMSADFQLKYTYKISEKFSVTAFGLVASGSSFSGAGEENGGLVTGEGGGIGLNYAFSDKLNIGVGNLDIIRQGAGDFSGPSLGAYAKLTYKFW